MQAYTQISNLINSNYLFKDIYRIPKKTIYNIIYEYRLILLLISIVIITKSNQLIKQGDDFARGEKYIIKFI